MFLKLLSLTTLLFFTCLSFVVASDSTKIEGYILDLNGEPIPNANIVLKNQHIGDVSDDNGYFLIERIKPGIYSIRCEHIAFKAKLIKNVEIANGQLINLGNITLEPRVLDLGSVMVTATRTDHNVYDVSIPINIVSRDELNERNSKTSAEALRDEVGIFVQKTNHGGGSAIIRGLNSNQVLLLVDGIRLNNSTYRLGNHQYLTTVDNNMVQQIEVVRGPSSVLYGSDALGGTINLVTVKPSLNNQGSQLHYRVLGRYASADNEKTTRSEITYQNHKYALQTGFSTKDFGDLTRGENSDHPEIENSTNGTKQTPSGFKAYDFDAKFIYGITPHQTIILASQLTEHFEVPRYDKYENNEYYRWIYDPQKRNLIYLLYENTALSRYVNSFKTTVSFHRQVEGRETQKNLSSQLSREKDDVQTIGITWQFNSLFKTHSFAYGAEIYLDKVESERFFIDPETRTKQKDVQGRYPDGSIYHSYGLFLQDEYELTTKLKTTLGIRHSYFYTKFDIPYSSEAAIQLGTIKQAFQATTGSLGLLFKLHENVFIAANLGQAFRAPNLSDISKLGDSKGEVYEVPNPNLEPEKMLSFDTGLNILSRTIKANATVFYANITDLIASANATYLGLPLIEKGGILYKVKSKQNIGNAFIRGIEASFDYNIYQNFMLHSFVTSVFGQNTTYNEPIGGIPPTFGLVGLKWKQQQYSVDFLVRFATKQHRLSADDMDDPRIPESGTPGWTIFNFRSGIKFSNYGILQFAIENIFDYNYREHGSGINGPGRNFIISLELKR